MAERGPPERDVPRSPKDDPDKKPEMRHYHVSQETIGAGGSGKVYDGLHLGSNSKTATKMLPVGEEYYSKETTAVRKEEENLLTLGSHVNVVGSFDAFQTNENHRATSMEQCDLEHLMKDRANRKTNVLIDVAYQTAKGLEALHTRDPPIVHMDLRPTHILVKLKPKITVEISGLTVSSIFDPGQVFVESPTAKQSADPFLGPEFYVARDGQSLVDGKFRVGTAADIFALGVVFLYMIHCNTSDNGKSRR